MSSNHPFEVSEITSLNALDLTVEVLEQRLELSYAWISPQPDDGCVCHCDNNHNCQNFCGGCGGFCSTLCNADCPSLCVLHCPSNSCPGGNCPVEPGDS